jgi:hypothetical protein
MELRRERFQAELLDPRRNFELARATVEVRWDPLTGQSCRLLPPGSFPPPAVQDLEAPVGTDLLVRLVGRAYVGPQLRSDAMWSERLHWEAATDLWPEAIADQGRSLFGADAADE